MIELQLGGATVRFTTRGEPHAAPVPLAWGEQVHGTHVDLVERPAGGPADGQATARRGQGVAVRIADCLPVALATPRAVAMLHAGWRGLAAGIVEEGVRVVRELDPDGPLLAAIGPGAGPCCYEVGEEVSAALGAGGRHPDLKAIAAVRLRECGAHDVHDVGLCTICDPRRFHSHRRDGTSERQAGMAWLS